MSKHLTVLTRKTTDHDLLAKIDKEISSITNRKTFLKGKIDNYEGNEQNHRREINRLNKELSTWKALRAVVELHKPDEKYGSFCDTCEEGRCPDCLSVDYPCPTIQAIEKELK